MDEFSPKRAGWFGAKRLAAALLGWPPVNVPLRSLLRWGSGGRKYFRFPVSVPEVAGFAGDGTFRMLEPIRCNIAKELFWGNGRRIKSDERFAVDLFHQLSFSADVVLDVGANTGLFAIAAALANPGARIDAYEIVPAICDLLEMNIARNELVGTVHPHCLGLGSGTGKITMPALHSADVLPLSMSSRVHVEEGVEVPIETLDTVAKDLPDEARVLMKVDVEGTEAEIFAGGHDFLVRLSPDILCEILPGSDFPKVQEFLDELGYEALLIGDAALEKRSKLAPDARHHDWLFTKRPEAELAEICARIG